MELEYGSKVIVIYAKNIQPIILDNFVLPRAAWPVTLAGAIVLRDTEIISGLMLAQSVNPSLPIISRCSGGFIGIESDTLFIQAPERSMLVYIKTPELFRNKYFQSKIPNRLGYKDWGVAGKKGIPDTVQDIVKNRIESYEKPEIDRMSEKQISRFVGKRVKG